MDTTDLRVFGHQVGEWVGQVPVAVADLLLGKLRPSAPAPAAPAKPLPACPYLNAEQAAAYLGCTVKALYGKVERGELRPLRWRRGRRVKYQFTREGLDTYMSGGKV